MTNAITATRIRDTYFEHTLGALNIPVSVDNMAAAHPSWDRADLERKLRAMADCLPGFECSYGSIIYRR